tara:strand:+ start:313 stop:684 length:372 start_codon:yes stop_codon:yes gene_type:complete
MSTLEVSNLNDGTTTVATTFVTGGSAKAWCSYNQDTPAIEDSFNISSFTDASTGIGQPNFTSNMSNALFVVTALGVDAGVYYMFASFDSRNVGFTQVTAHPNSAPTTTQDPSDFCVSVNGDLA